MNVRIAKIAILLLALSAFAGCEQEGGNNGRGIIGGGDSGNNGGTDAGDTTEDSTSDADEDGATDDAGDAEGDVDPDACQPETDEDMCERLDFECGTLTDVDNCGDERTIDSCGDEATVCGEFETCGGGDTEGQCGCTKTTCDDEGVLCGEIDDTCGGTLTCDSFCVDSIGAGDNHNCAVGSGNLKCWGNGRDGQLGTGGTSNANNPADVVGLSNDVTQVGPGSAHTCILNNAEQVLCWGNNSQSQLGVGTTVSTSNATDPAISSNAQQVVSGRVHSCAIVSGGVECWGANDRGQLGDPNFQYSSLVGLPNAVPNLTSGVTQLAAGLNHTCALLDTGQVTCWGEGREGQLGDRILDNQRSFESVDGDWYAFVRDTADGYFREPGVVNAAADTPLTDVVQISAGATHTCALTSNDELYCWGALNSGEDCTGFDVCSIFPAVSGLPTTTYRTGDPPRIDRERYNRVAIYPTQIDPGFAVQEVASGRDHICMRVDESDTAKTNVYCMGRNGSGQVGDGSTNKWDAPRPLATDGDGNVLRATQISIGANHSCALADNNNVKCWGSNADGQIGNSDLQRDETLRPFDVKLNQ
ncbi:MAG: RCC1 domain-containing protein [Myxococcota bacterium]